MLYLTTRSKHDAYTAHRTLCADLGPDGGMFLPYCMPVMARQEVLALADKSFSQCVADVLNSFLSCRLTGWDVEFCIGRYPVKTEDISHRIIVAQTWQNQAWDYAWAELALAEKICPEELPEGKPSAWLKIAIRIAFLTGIFADLIRQGIADPEHPVDVAVPGGDFSVPMSVWYGRQMGLPIANIICGCDGDGAVWDLLHLGAVKADMEMPAHFERLVCGALGFDEANRYSQICKDGGVYSLLPVDAEKLRRGMFAAVISSDRLEATILGAQRTSGYVLGPESALGYGALLDFRAKTGENRPALLLAERSPVLDALHVASCIGMTVAELKEKLK